MSSLCLQLCYDSGLIKTIKLTGNTKCSYFFIIISCILFDLLAWKLRMTSSCHITADHVYFFYKTMQTQGPVISSAWTSSVRSVVMEMDLIYIVLFIAFSTFLNTYESDTCGPNATLLLLSLKCTIMFWYLAYIEE